MKKKMLAVLLGITLCFGATACGDDKTAGNNPPETQNEQKEPEKKPETGDESKDETQNSVPTLICDKAFTKTEPVVTDNDYKGGYFYSEKTEDGQTVITNCCFETDIEAGANIDDYLSLWMEDISDSEIVDILGGEENKEYSEKMKYPVYLASCQRKDGTQTDAFFLLTDTHAYCYAFTAPIEWAAEMKEVWQEAFLALHLEEL